MARGGLGSAWSLKVAAVWTNLPVSHVTPSVSPGMWEEAAHPRSCHTVSALPFFFFFFFLPFPPPPPSPAISFCVDAACKRLTSYLEHPERMAALLSWLLLFFPSKFKVARLFLHVVKKVSCLWLCLYAALNFPTSLAPPNSAGDSMAWKVAEVCPAGLWFKKNFQQQLMLKTQSLLLDNELNLTRNATNGSVSVFSTHAVNRIFKQAEPHMFRIC